ncbi:MAG: hypothetical protein LBI13_02255 [Streptococcaceae bacterium]|jgi:disulfide oxidoreductase YuzD|nr:hypothetical protein [Streptococcaceae bacterium]
MSEEEAFKVLNNFQVDAYHEGSYFVIKYKYSPHTKNGKLFLQAFNLIFGKHGRYITYGENKVEYQVVEGRFGAFEGSEGLTAALIRKHTQNFAFAYLRFVENSNVNIQTENLEIQNAHKVTIYAEFINRIKAEKFMYEDELLLNSNYELLEAVNRIEQNLEEQLNPSRQDVSVLRSVAKSASELAGFAANIITIISPFISMLR